MNDSNAPDWWHRPCSECRSFTRHGLEPIGTCALGGPDPSEGCSDVKSIETCPKWETRP